jgi:hypothetical protein
MHLDGYECVLDWDEDTRASCIRGRAGGHVLTRNSPRPSLRIYREDTHHNLEYIRFIRNALWRDHKGW